MQIRAALSRRAKALAESHCSCGLYSWRGPIDFSGRSHAANSSSSAFASVKSRVSKASGGTVNRSQTFARLLHLALDRATPDPISIRREVPGAFY